MTTACALGYYEYPGSNTISTNFPLPSMFSQFWPFLEKNLFLNCETSVFCAFRSCCNSHSKLKFVDYFAEIWKCQQKNWCTIFKIELIIFRPLEISLANFARIFRISPTKSTFSCILWRNCYQCIRSGNVWIFLEKCEISMFSVTDIVDKKSQKWLFTLSGEFFTDEIFYWCRISSQFFPEICLFWQLPPGTYAKCCSNFAEITEDFVLLYLRSCASPFCYTCGSKCHNTLFFRSVHNSHMFLNTNILRFCSHVLACKTLLMCSRAFAKLCSPLQFGLFSSVRFCFKY